jgi:membrane-bound lytic murein transglycosylase MltF
MLKTQLSKAIYLCLICFVASSFVPGPSSTPSISDEKTNTETPFIVVIQPAHTYQAPKIKLNRQAMQFANHYVKVNADDLVDIKQRSKAPFAIMDEVFHRYGLPVELKYLAVIESDLKTSALSHVGALGPWQLMPETAHDLGLKVTRGYDERTNYYKSTKAAALYLRDLYARFGDWLLVLAAYNSGPRPVLNAIQRSGSRNFWALQSFLPAETRGHVKRFIATHYYFEGQGSVTTSTKAENIAYARSVNEAAMAAALASQKRSENLTGTSDLSVWNILYSIEKSDKAKEPKDEQFKKLMKASEESLQKANKTMQG